MTTKLKKVGSAGRFGPRYGKKVRDRVVRVEKRQKLKQTCPHCNKKGAKREANGIWFCQKCNKKFASNTYFIE